MSNVRHGLCVGGPKHGQSLATMTPGVVRHLGDASGMYIYKAAVGADPSKFLWIKAKDTPK